MTIESVVIARRPSLHYSRMSTIDRGADVDRASFGYLPDPPINRCIGGRRFSQRRFAALTNHPQDTSVRDLVIVACVAVVFVLAVAGCGGSSDRSQQIAAQIGDGALCTATSFTITNRLDGSKTRLYDCRTNSKGEICVTEQNGVVNDVTASARLLFANTLGTNTPTCAE